MAGILDYISQMHSEPVNNMLELMVRLEGANANFLPHRIFLTHIDESSIWPDQIYKEFYRGIMLGIVAIQGVVENWTEVELMRQK